MFPQLPTCSPFANKIPHFKPEPGSAVSVICERLSWNYRFDRSVRHGEIFCALCADAHFNCRPLLSVSAYPSLNLSNFLFSSHPSVKESVISEVDLFLYYFSDFISWLHDASRKTRSEMQCRGDRVYPEVKRILTFEYCFYCNASRQEYNKWRQKRRSGDRSPPCVTSCEPECHL